jgi:hypothetical protein
MRAVGANPPAHWGFDDEAPSPLFGSPLRVMKATEPQPRDSPGAAIHVGIGDATAYDLSVFDILLTQRPDAHRPWVSVPNVDEAVSALSIRVNARPKAAATFAQVLRVGQHLPFADALLLESFAYSSLLGGAEFKAWRRDNPARPFGSAQGEVLFQRDGDDVVVTLARPHSRNALSADLRSALIDRLRNVRDDPTIRLLTLRGQGPAFCAGGDLDEFDGQDDLAAAHFIRTLHAPALILHQCSALTIAHVQGACIGAGVEIAAACKRVEARADAFFQLPEIAMGLIPGAGGTVTLPRRIGRHRTCYLGLIGGRIDAATAHAWGLVDAMVDTP